MKRIILIFSLIMFYQNSFGQKRVESAQMQNDRIMAEMIMQLKDGVLITRLFTKENSINALRKQNKNDLADQLEVKQKKYNKEIISGFKRKFKFCPVYFFFSNYTDSILSKQIDGIVFLNDSLQPDPSIKLNGKKFLVAEFANLTKDTAKYFNQYYYEMGEKGLEKKAEYHGGSDMKRSALRILSDSLVQLKKPFPYYISTHTTLGRNRTLDEIVEMMNQKLEHYYLNVRK
jgi:hypothetical protein